ncbi:ABC transporter permease [Neobacillus soli]|uniref:ABC transporter permease n=1 Tax=Neobacillus soli TaxID=220688 RepID=UPI0008270707|nr:ABC transporter permease [Neobacillus soli]
MIIANILNETEKLWKHNRTKGFLLLAILLPVISAIILHYLPNNLGIGSNLPMLMLRLFTFSLLPLFLFMSASEAFSGEVASNTLKLGLVRPITRAKVFASKVAAITIFLAILLGVIMITTIISGWLVPGGDYASGLLDIFTAYAAAFIPLMAIGCVSVFIAQFFNKSSGALVTMILIYTAAKFVPFIFPALSVWSIFSYTNWYVLWIGNGAPFVKLANSFILMLSYCIMAYSAGVILFEKKQL